jgi:3-hydroxyacyl-CoA dehydrogenase
MGLVEVGVGVIPAGGGTTQAIVRALSCVPKDMVTSRFPFIMRAFMNLGMAQVSNSADKARDLMYLRDVDGVTLNRDKLIWDAKQVALGMARTGYRTPIAPQNLKLPGLDGYATLFTGLQDMAWGKKITEYDFVVAQKLAYIMCGGDIRPNSIVTEQHLLDLEKEAFLSLCGEERTRARMKHMLDTGKPLRN